ncbi:hypothetical protein SLEP1_g28602 [Rubroshorea leprosula]|uniref:Uncharacterized protein n=1 Tax=Rubroshorea leprosula TaxID=152421 RepID=A0AAV5JUA9_9ROSI|nr:hypothetical protein SLEP1_g28602 [Rubroshorea leprosula]
MLNIIHIWEMCILVLIPKINWGPNLKVKEETNVGQRG